MSPVYHNEGGLACTNNNIKYKKHCMCVVVCGLNNLIEAFFNKHEKIKQMQGQA